jgi:hypothetical protein
MANWADSKRSGYTHSQVAAVDFLQPGNTRRVPAAGHRQGLDFGFSGSATYTRGTARAGLIARAQAAINSAVTVWRIFSR